VQDHLAGDPGTAPRGVVVLPARAANLLEALAVALLLAWDDRGRRTLLTALGLLRSQLACGQPSTPGRRRRREVQTIRETAAPRLRQRSSPPRPGDARSGRLRAPRPAWPRTLARAKERVRDRAVPTRYPGADGNDAPPEHATAETAAPCGQRPRALAPATTSAAPGSGQQSRSTNKKTAAQRGF
jgi:hypothetical protein